MSLLERFEIAFRLPDVNDDGMVRSTSSMFGTSPPSNRFSGLFESDEGPIGTYLIPALLPEDQPSAVDDVWPFAVPESCYQLGRIYTFKFMPLGFFSRLFVRNLHLPGVTQVPHVRSLRNC